MERTKERSSFRKKFIGDRKFYMMVLAVAVPIMIQNGITNFVSLLDNIMIGRIGTEQKPACGSHILFLPLHPDQYTKFRYIRPQ